MIGSSFRILILGCALGALGCAKGAPNISALDSSNLPQPTFSGQTSTTMQVESASEPIAVNGECDSRINSLLVTAVGVGNPLSLATVTTSGVSLNCTSSGTFAFTFTSLSALGFSAQGGQTYQVELRGVTSGGVSNPSVVNIAYIPGQGPHRIYISSGATESKSGGERIATSDGNSFKATVRLHNGSNATTGNEALVKTSTSFTLKSSTAANY